MKTRIEHLRLGDLALLERNARYMRPETFRRLVENIRRDGQLTSTPFAVREADGTYRVLSGNHRTKAAIEALGPDHVAAVMVTDDELTPAQRLAVQLSHNSITGEDDPVLLRELWEEIPDVEWKDYAGLDDEVLGTVGSSTADALAPPGLDYQVVTVMFLPEEAARAGAILEEARGTADETWLCRSADAERMFDLLAEASAAHGVRNTATAMMLVLDLVERHLADLAAPFDGETRDAWVPLAAVAGTNRVPAIAAVAIGAALARAVRVGHVAESAPWQLFEFLAGEYLAGPPASPELGP